jgi:elongation factor G
MLEALAMFSDEMMELLLGEEEVPQELIYTTILHQARSQAQELTPVFIGSAYKNKGVQPLLDAIVRYLPSPLDREVKRQEWDNPTEAFPLARPDQAASSAMAFKIVEDPYGQLTFMRIYQGTMTKGETYVNQRTTKKERFSRIVRMHADKREEIDFGRRRRHRRGHGRRLRER